MAQTLAGCDIDVAAFPSVLTVTNFHGLDMLKETLPYIIPQSPLTSTLHQGFNYPEPLGRGQQRVLFNPDGTAGLIGCAQHGLAVPLPSPRWWGSPERMFHSAKDGTRPELAAISEGYVKVYVNNAGTNAAENPTTTKSTIYYNLCTVATNGAETCPSNYLTLGEFAVTDNPFIHITDLDDGEYNLKVYSNITTCSTTTCPPVRTDSADPLQIPFVVITSPPSVTITSTDMPYINSDTRTSHLHFQSNLPSRFSGRNTDTKYQSPTQTATAQTSATLAVYHTLFQVKAPWATTQNTWRSPIPDNDDGRAMYWLNIPENAAQGEYTFEVLTMLVSNYTTPNAACASAACSFECPSMCLSDFTNLANYDATKHPYMAYSSSPATRSFTYDPIPPEVEATCQVGEEKCSGVLYSKKSLSFSFSCTDSNAPCTFYCAIDGKPTLDPSAAAALPKGYTPCTSPAAVHAKASGSNTFTVYAVDAAGNKGDVSRPFTFYTDNTAPEVNFGGIAKRCLLDERYFVPDLHASGPASSSAAAFATNNIATGVGGHCLPDNGGNYGQASTGTEPDTQISGQYGSPTCTCGAYSIQTSASSSVLFAHNQGTFPSLMSADSDTSLNTYLGYYPKTIPDAGLEQVGDRQTGQQYLVDGTTLLNDSDQDFDIDTNAGSQSTGFMLYDVGIASNTSDDITSTNGMYDTVVQVDLDITREVYNLPSGKYGAVLATKKVNGNYYYHVLEATNSPNAQVNMVCKHPEIKNCIQSSQNPFQMDCGMLI